MSTTLPILQNTCISFGFFDGVHKGHSDLLTFMLANKEGLSSVVLAFDPKKEILMDEKILSTAKEKKYLLQTFDLDHVFSYPLTSENFRCDPDTFIKDVLVDTLGAKKIVAGTTCQFLGGGNITHLRNGAKKWGYTLLELQPTSDIDTESIKIALQNGDLQAANNLLGHPYLILGKVIHGKALGRTVGMPTANLSYSKRKFLPRIGVYGTFSKMKSDLMVKGLTNIGTRPSVDTLSNLSIETFLLDFSDDLYEKTFSIELYAFIRGVIKFDNLAQVKNQVDKDIQTFNKILKN